MSTTVNEAFKTETSVTEKLASGNSTITQTLTGDTWVAQGGADQFYAVTLENPNSNPGNSDVSQQIQFTTTISDLNYFGVTAGSYTTVDGETMPATSQRIKFSGTFQSTTQGLELPTFSTIDASNTYHYLDGTTYSYPTYKTISISSNYTWEADGTDEFATDFDFRCRIGAIEDTSSNVWSESFLIGPRFVGTVTDYWEGSRFIIDGLDGDTPPSITVQSTLTEDSSILKSASCSLSSDFTTTATVKNLVGFPGEGDYVATDYVDTGYFETLDLGGTMEQNLASDATLTALGGVIIDVDVSIAGDAQVTALPGYLFSTTETLTTDAQVTALGGITIDSDSQSIAGDSQVVALGGLVINGGTVSSATDSQQTAQGNVIYSLDVDLTSDTFGTVTARANILGEIVLASQFTLNSVPSNKIFADANIAADTATQLSAGIILSGSATIQADSQQTATGGRVYLIDDILESTFAFTGTEITDLVTGAAILNAGSFQLTTGRNWLIDRYYTLIVPDENRDFQVLPDTRVVVVEDENRNYLIKTETRALEVEQETRKTPSPLGLAVITDRRTERV